MKPFDQPIQTSLFHVCPRCEYILVPRPDIPFNPDSGRCPGCGEPLQLTPEQLNFWRDVKKYMAGLNVPGDTDSDDLTQIDQTFTVPESLLRTMPRSLQFTLHGEQGHLAGESVILTSRQFVIGRTMGDLLIPDPRLSRKHTQIEILSRDIYYIKDLASRNGTYVNDQRVSYGRLCDGDRIRVGSSIFLFRVTFQPKDGEVRI